MDIERQKPIYSNNLIGNGLFLFGVVVFIAFVYSAWSLMTSTSENKTSAIVLSSVWVVGVPIYFFIEHVYFFRKFGDNSQFDQFKRLQDQARLVWVAAVLVLIAVSKGDFPIP